MMLLWFGAIVAIRLANASAWRSSFGEVAKFIGMSAARYALPGQPALVHSGIGFAASLAMPKLTMDTMRGIQTFVEKMMSGPLIGKEHEHIQPMHNRTPHIYDTGGWDPALVSDLSTTVAASGCLWAAGQVWKGVRKAFVNLL